jgi:hypothetical protein
MMPFLIAAGLVLSLAGPALAQSTLILPEPGGYPITPPVRRKGRGPAGKLTGEIVARVVLP